MSQKETTAIEIRGKEYTLMDAVAGGARWITVVGALFVFSFPIYWIITRSLMTELRAFQLPPVWIPKEPTLEAYTSILLQGPYSEFLVNSILATVIGVGLGLILGVPATYALVVYEFDYNLDKHLSFFLISLFMLPPIVTSISYYRIFTSAGLYDTSIGLGLIYGMFNIPLIVWFTRGFITDVPDTLRESARLDGANEFQIFYRIYLPLIRPGLAAAAIISFIITWNEYLLALLLTSNQAKTLPVGLQQFVGQYNIAWNELSAGLILVMLPGVLFLVVTQRYIVSGLTKGAVKE